MRRSDMIKDLASELILAWLDVYETPESLPGFGKAQELADRILSRAEKEGMLPPMLLIPEYAFQAPNEWEPEEEEMESFD